MLLAQRAQQPHWKRKQICAKVTIDDMSMYDSIHIVHDKNKGVTTP
jgi:hypothetical protein